jgi:polyhydroxyalkanoate synthase
MNAPFSQFAFPEWMTQWSNPEAFQAIMKPLLPNDTQALVSQFGEKGVQINPAAVTQLQNEYMAEFASLWQDFTASKTPALHDRRFSTSPWQENAFHAFTAAAYLLNSRFLSKLAESIEAPPKVKRKIGFAVQQMIDAMSPSNFLVTNPVAQKRIIDTQGESLTKGITQLLNDMQRGRISQTDETAFEIGRNVAMTEGAVVFENPLFQLIQYKPLTKKVHEKPLLIVPPCINKFYILDLQPDNSFVRYAIAEGHTVFLMSWRSADESVADATWERYVEEGVMKAMSVVQSISGQPSINALGFCVGGTLLSTAVAIAFARGEKPVSSLTLLTTFLDFSDAGALDVYIDDAQISLREQHIGKGGVMPGRDFSTAFSSLRPNDLVWNYVENNYLKGEKPPAFDLLYWNADGTDLPGPMFCYYLRYMYLENKLKEPGALTMAGQAVDLRKINVPTYIYASREDHIVPWKSAYESTNILNQDDPKRNRFVLGASGHIAGVINSPSKNKRNYWVSDASSINPDAWLEGAAEVKGSWWPNWVEFLSEHAGKQVAAPKTLGSAECKEIEPAPGRYVKVKAAG